MVVVAVNYRLGPFGWFRHAALRAGADVDDASGNYGTLDLIQALAWVRENLAVFGSDPERVTIFGESAGGRNVVSRRLSPRARGFFQRAIVQSGGTAATPIAVAEGFVDDDPAVDANASGEILLRLLASGVPRSEAKARIEDTPDAVLTARLRAVSAGDLGRQTSLLFTVAKEHGRRELARTMTAYWSSFARDGDPNGPPISGMPHWEAYDGDGRFLVLDTTASGGIRTERGRVTAQEALAGVFEDSSLTSPEAKCSADRNFVRWAHDPSPSAYPQLLEGAYAGFPLGR